MNAQNPRHLSRQSAERALDGTGRSGDAGLDAVLRLAKAPGSTFELNGEAEAVAMFRTARAAAAPVAAPRASATLCTRARKVRWLVAGTAAAVFASTGVALAATGNLPGSLGGGHAHHRPAPTASARPEHSPTTSGTRAPATSVRGLCEAYDARKGAGEHPLADPAFSSLVRRAGGAAQVPAYCAEVLATPSRAPAGGQGAHPSTPASTQGAEPEDPATTANPGDGDTAGSGSTPGTAPSSHPTHPAHPTHPPHPAHPTRGVGNGASVG